MPNSWHPTPNFWVAFSGVKVQHRGWNIGLGHNTVWDIVPWTHKIPVLRHFQYLGVLNSDPIRNKMFSLTTFPNRRTILKSNQNKHFSQLVSNSFKLLNRSKTIHSLKQFFFISKHLITKLPEILKIHLFHLHLLTDH